MKIYYFGCWSECGHFLFDHTAHRKSQSNIPEDFPIHHAMLDCGLLPPRQPQTEGLATFAHINGWSVLAFWDRSIDSRPNSNSAFLVDHLRDFEDVCETAKEYFPSVWNRFKFPIVQRTQIAIDQE